MRLDISRKLDRSDPYWGIWKSTSDSLRVHQDINNSGRDIFTAGLQFFELSSSIDNSSMNRLFSDDTANEL